MKGRTFAYCRVSTLEQDTENQVLAIRSAGIELEDHRIIEEKISGSVEAMKRTKFKSLIDHKLETGDTLVVLKLDRLGRDNIDLQNTINQLTNRNIKVISLDLPVSDLTTSEGKLMIQLFSAFAEFERNRIRERTVEGLVKAKAKGIRLGRPEGSKNITSIQTYRTNGLSQSKVANILGVSLSTVKRHWNTYDILESQEVLT